MGLREIEKLNPRIAAEVGEVLKEIDMPEPPKDCKFPELWFKCRENLRGSEDVVTKAKVQSCYDESVKEITAKHASFIGNEVIPELGRLMSQERIDITNKQKVMDRLQQVGRNDITSYLKALDERGYIELVKHVKIHYQNLLF